MPGNEGQLDGLQALGFQALDTRAPLESAYYMGNGLSGTGVADEDYYARLDADHAAKLAHSEGGRA